MKVPALACFLQALTAFLAPLLPTNCFGNPGDLYVADPIARAILKFTPAGDRSTFAANLYQPVALAFDRKGNLFVGDSGAGIPQMPSIIFKYAPDGTKSTFASIGFNQLLGLAFDGAGNLFVSTGADILKLAPNGTQSTFAASVDPWALAFNTSGNLYATTVPIGPGSIVKFALDGTSYTTLTTFQAGHSATALAFDQTGHLFALLDGPILKVEPNGSYTTFVAGDYSDALAYDNAGNLFAALRAYTPTAPAIVKISANGTVTTFALGEIFTAALAFEPVTDKLRNISARGLVGTADNALISGFIVGGNALADRAVVVRAIGPSLTHAGIANPLLDPVLELHNSTGAIIASNDNWQDTQGAQITASGLAPSNPNESAIFATLPDGNYTAVVRGASNTTGVAVVEVYGVAQ